MPRVSKPQLRFIVRKDKLALRCTYNGKSAEIKLDLPSVNFDKKKQMYIKDRKLNLQLDSILTTCEVKINNGCTNVKEIINFDIQSDKPDKYSFTYNVEKYFAENDLQDSTKEIWKSCLKHLITCFGDEMPNFDDMSFVQYFHEIGLSDSTISMYLSRCRALGLKINKKYFKKYKVAKRDFYLNEQQMANVMKAFVEGERHPSFIFFCIMLRTGLAPVDLFKMKRNDVTFFKDNYRNYVQFVGKRAKTNVPFKIVLQTYRDDIIHYVWNSHNGDYFLPHFEGLPDEKKNNRVSGWLEYNIKPLREILKNVDDTIEVDKVTFYCARHSCVMRLLNKNIPPAQLATFLGRSINTLHQYFHDLETSQMLEMANAL